MNQALVIGNFVKFDPWVNISQVEKLWSQEADKSDNFRVKYALISHAVTYDAGQEFSTEEDAEYYIVQFLRQTVKKRI